MREQILLDDSSYDEIMEKALEKLHNQAPWWTHTEISDPGIMLIEMWALLSDMQSFYLDQVQESHYRKYLKLLGVRPDEGECAWTWLFFEFGKEADEEYIVPKGTKLLSHQMVFETDEEVRLTKNCLRGFYQADNENRADAMKLFRKSRFVLEDRIENRRELFSFIPEKPLKPEEDFRFFVLLDEKGKRNRAEEDFCMVQLVWEYRIRGRWQEVKAVRDDTRGLLFSGIIILRMVSPVRAGKAERVRCRIRQGAYDVMPALYKICLNVVKAVQRDTLCSEEDVTFAGDSRRMMLKSYLAKTGRLWILRKTDRKQEETESNGELWEDITSDVCVDAPIRAGHMERYISYAGTGHVKIVCMDTRIAPEELEGQVTGIAAQKFFLPWKKLLRSSVKLMIRQPREWKNLYRFYCNADPEEDRYPNVWHWEEEENTIVLGDGRHGEIPPEAENGLHLTSLILWEGEKGNVAVGRSIQWEQPELFPHITCTNPLAGRDGRNRKLPSEQFAEMKEMLLRQNRMVTEEDIRILVMNTPGLMIREVKTGWKDAAVTVNVTPAYPLEAGYCMEWYRKQVEKHLEPYRLAGTKIRIEIENGNDFENQEKSMEDD